MIAVTLDPADPALDALILSTAREEFENFVLSSHVMQAVGIFYGMYSIIISYTTVFIRIDSAINEPLVGHTTTTGQALLFKA